ncbi:MAG: ROK family protein [Oscillospiraceae bacterium]|jgi:predicted NBD/HSP70 family sugar kinase|nr:ROK family protein [Oscillospiraceae bacterium]
MSAKVNAPLDAEFIPVPVVLREFLAKTKDEQKIVIGVERSGGNISVFPLTVYKDGTGHDDDNYDIVERIVKSLLWIYGGWKVIIAGSDTIGAKVKAAYSVGGAREFDRKTMSDVYEHDFTVESVPLANAPVRKETFIPAAKNTKGCRIGFDAGGSDRKVSAVIDGETVYDEEVVWFPKTNDDPKYHYEGIKTAFQTAASKMPRVDAIGVSSAGIYVDNKIMLASLFVKVPKTPDNVATIKNMYTDIAKEVAPNAPLVVANDGDVSALAGAMVLNDNAVLGVAMGTSEAVGYVDGNGDITGWLNEMAFVPLDFNKASITDEWSGDYGCGVKYLSQDSVIKLAPKAGIELDPSLSPAEKLKVIQKAMTDGNPDAPKIYETIGVYFGYAIAYYALFMEIRHVLFLGRVSSGKGGEIVLEYAKKVLAEDFPDLAKGIDISLPDEKFRRVGQSFAAASL